MCLAVSFVGKKTHFLDLRIKSYGCLKFQGEVWVGWACVGANEKELTTLQKVWRQGGWREKGSQYWGTHVVAVATELATNNRLSAMGHNLSVSSLFF